ncbi:MAG TPA: histidine ammonia-lyase [Acidobacteria bacterium]|nr:histidine ammonia-lyase [Acidobacteriota bacterium]
MSNTPRKSHTIELLEPGVRVGLAELRRVYSGPVRLELGAEVREGIDAAQATVEKIVRDQRVTYGINTGLGQLAQTVVDPDRLRELQTNLVRSHSVGLGTPLDDGVVRLVLMLKVLTLARGRSGVRNLLVDTLMQMLDSEVYPLVPSKGSVGASGDLAPLAHLAGVLIGEGRVRYQGEVLPASEGLAAAGIKPIELAPKEGIALVNGTQVSTSLALTGLFAIEDLFAAAILSGALSVDAVRGSVVPFDERIQLARGQHGQIVVAAVFRALLRDSAIHESHRDCGRVQDPYSLRCQPQVMGACLDVMSSAAGILETEANAVTDNPLVFAETGDVLSGGNFHAEPVAIAADILAIAVAEIGALSERRIALLVDAHLSGLPPFLTEHSGVESGFMVAQITAAALASENKTLAHPASVDSLPTSANQEDHVSMATFAGRRLSEMADNTAGIVAIELLAAAQGVEYHHPLQTAQPLQRVIEAIRDLVPSYVRDRAMSLDIEAMKAWARSGQCRSFVSELHLPSSVAP